MSEFKLRPRFHLEVYNPENEVEDIVRNKLKYDNPNKFESTIIKGHLILRINKNKRHFWSPQMDISLREMEEGGTQIRCLLAPEPAVWTMFMFIYSATGFGSFIGLMIAMSQWTLEREMWGIYVSLISAILGLIAFFAAQAGKKIAHDEMSRLKTFVLDIRWNKKGPD
ncbi:MAG: hypothetical protein RIE58_09760 [Vicingaceae bacterium]